VGNYELSPRYTLDFLAIFVLYRHHLGSVFLLEDLIDGYNINYRIKKTKSYCLNLTHRYSYIINSYHDDDYDAEILEVWECLFG